jgi:hypothetical protein
VTVCEVGSGWSAASVFRIDPGTGERLGSLATAAVGEGGWVDLTELMQVLAADCSSPYRNQRPEPGQPASTHFFNTSRLHRTALPIRMGGGISPLVCIPQSVRSDTLRSFAACLESISNP